MGGQQQERGGEEAPARGDARGASPLPGPPRAWARGAGRGARAASREAARAPARAAQPTRRPRGRPRRRRSWPDPLRRACPTHPLPGARGESRGRHRPTARPSCPRGGDGRGRKCAAGRVRARRSRTRRRSTLGGAHPSLLRGESIFDAENILKICRSPRFGEHTLKVG